MHRIRTAALGAAAALALAGLATISAGPAGAAATKPMSTARAAKVYTGAVCPFNAVWKEYTVAVDNAKAAGNPLTTGSTLPAPLKDAAARAAAASVEAEGAFRKPPAPWPAKLVSNVDVAIAYNAQATAYFRAIADATTMPAATPLFDAMVEAQKINLPILRTGLGLPSDDPCADRSATPVATPGTVGPVATEPGSLDGYWIAGNVWIIRD